MPTRAFITIEDYNQETSTVSFSVQDVSAVNFASVTQDIDEVKDALLTVISGEVRQVGFTKTYPESFATVTDTTAQRERKWLVVYRDTTQFLDELNTMANPGYGKLFTMEIATADLSIANILKPQSDEMDLTEAVVGAPFVSAIEANVRSPYNGNAFAPSIDVIRVVHVGRNS